MARLYCERHGREHEAMAAAHQTLYREAGESVLIVKGTLRSGPWLGDACNAMLTSGLAAYLVTPLSRHHTDSTYDYAFDRESEYFNLRRVEATLYGSLWPGIASGDIRLSPASRRRAVFLAWRDAPAARGV